MRYAPRDASLKLAACRTPKSICPRAPCQQFANSNVELCAQVLSRAPSELPCRECSRRNRRTQQTATGQRHPQRPMALYRRGLPGMAQWPTPTARRPNSRPELQQAAQPAALDRFLEVRRPGTPPRARQAPCLRPEALMAEAQQAQVTRYPSLTGHQPSGLITYYAEVRH